MVEKLKKEWVDIASKYRNDETLIETLWDEIYSRYSSKKRHYHNLEHINNMLSLAKEHDNDSMDYDKLRLAIWYHDIVYKPKRSDNEVKSGDIALDRCRELGFGVKSCEGIRKAIIASKSHTTNTIHENFRHVFLDLDLAILATSWKEYLSYTKKIRKEYSMFPDFLYKKGRKKVLQHFLERPQIYHTQKYRDLWEAKARENIQKELTLL
jgi:predicted metal-dependent HD superfamily phosphohydrolase